MDIFLRALEIEDYKIISKWRNDPEVTEKLVGSFFFNSPDREKKWVEEVIMNDRTHLRLGVALKSTGKLIGLINLTGMDYIHRNAEYSILMGDKEEWGKGYAKQATREILNFGFNERNLERIYLYVDVDHSTAIGLYKKIGFKKEGLLRKHHFRNGNYRDVFIFSLLKEEYV